MTWSAFTGIGGLIAQVEDETTRLALREIDKWAQLVTLPDDEPGERQEAQIHLGGISVTYDNATTSANSVAIGTDKKYRAATFTFQVTKAGTPTSLKMALERSLDGGTTWSEESSVTATATENLALTATLAGGLARIAVTATGTTAVNTFALVADVVLGS